MVSVRGKEAVNAVMKKEDEASIWTIRCSPNNRLFTPWCPLTTNTNQKFSLFELRKSSAKITMYSVVMMSYCKSPIVTAREIRFLLG